MYKIMVTILFTIFLSSANIETDSSSKMIEQNNRSSRGGSQIVSKVKQFLPNLKEVGFFTNLLNVYFQVSQFVRTTNKVVSTMSKVKSDIRKAGNSIKKVYNTIQELKEISLYDMATWQATCQRLNFIATESTSGLIGIYDNMLDHSVGAAHQYLIEVSNINEQVERKKYVLGITSDYYLNKEYESTMSLITGAVGQRFQQQIKHLEDLYALESSKKDPNWSTLNRLAWEIARYERMLEDVDDYIPAHKVDTIIATCHELITTNIMEINDMEYQLQKIEDEAAELIDAYNKLKDGNISTTPKDPKEIGNDLKDVAELYSDHPNDVEKPEKPEGGEDPTTSKKEVSAQDILQLENGILFLLYKQDIMKRDISAMKLNTMTFITVLEAFEQEQQEMKVSEVSTKEYMMALRVEDFINE